MRPTVLKNQSKIKHTLQFYISEIKLKLKLMSRRRVKCLKSFEMNTEYN